MGELLDRLEMDGVLDNTIVIWTTDHGDGLPRYKRALYDTGIRVPMVVRFPDGRLAGDVREDLVSFVDIAPTILALAGVEAPDYLAGQDIFDAATPPRDYVYAARDRFDEEPDHGRAIRDMHYKYIRNYMPDRPFYADLAYRNNIVTMQELMRLNEQGQLSDLQASYFNTPRPSAELFDLTSDPYEIRNLADHPAYAHIVERLDRELESWIERTGDMGGEMTELEMAETFWPGGVQPETDAPTVKLVNGRRDAKLESETPGASIEYRYVNLDPGTEEEWNSWKLYREDVPLQEGKAIEARAVRY